MRLRLPPALLLLLVGLAAATPGLADRVDGLIARWRGGDAAARAGVVAETSALGPDAIAELYARIAEPAAAGPGLAGLPELAGPVPLGDRLVTLETRFARGAAPAEGDGGEWARARVLPAGRAALLELDGAVAAPRLTVFDGQRANVTVTRRESRVEARDDEGGAVVGTVAHGLLLDARPRVRRNGEQVELALRFVHSEPCRAPSRIATARGTVDLAEVRRYEAAVTITLERGEPTLLWLPGAPGDRPWVVTITARPLAAAEVPGATR